MLGGIPLCHLPFDDGRDHGIGPSPRYTLLWGWGLVFSTLDYRLRALTPPTRQFGSCGAGAAGKGRALRRGFERAALSSGTIFAGEPLMNWGDHIMLLLMGLAIIGAGAVLFEAVGYIFGWLLG
jgi:hypothetical protein